MRMFPCAYGLKGIFAQFRTMQVKKILARAIKIQKESMGNHRIKKMIKPQSWEKMRYIVLYFKAFSNFCRIILCEKCLTTRIVLFGFQYPLVNSAFSA